MEGNEPKSKRKKKKETLISEEDLGGAGFQHPKKIIKKIHAVVERGAPYPFSVGSNEMDPRRYKK